MATVSNHLRMLRRAVVAIGWILVGLAFEGRADVLTQRNDNQRTGANTAETTLTTKNVAPDTFGKLWTLYTDGQVVVQPLYVESLDIDTRTSHDTPPLDGTFDAVVIATMHNTVYVYAANQ